jgi:hypothetical protein
MLAVQFVFRYSACTFVGNTGKLRGALNMMLKPFVLAFTGVAGLIAIVGGLTSTHARQAMEAGLMKEAEALEDGCATQAAARTAVYTVPSDLQSEPEAGSAHVKRPAPQEMLGLAPRLVRT